MPDWLGGVLIIAFVIAILAVPYLLFDLLMTFIRFIWDVTQGRWPVCPDCGLRYRVTPVQPEHGCSK